MHRGQGGRLTGSWGRDVGDPAGHGENRCVQENGVLGPPSGTIGTVCLTVSSPGQPRFLGLLPF